MVCETESKELINNINSTGSWAVNLNDYNIAFSITCNEFSTNAFTVVLFGLYFGHTFRKSIFDTNFPGLHMYVKSVVYGLNTLEFHGVWRHNHVFKN